VVILNWWRVAICLAILAAFLAIPVWLLADNYINSAGTETTPDNVNISSPRDNYFGSLAEIYTPPQIGDLCVTFEFNGFDQATSHVDLGIVINATVPGKEQLEPLESDHKMGTLILDSNSGLGNFSVQFALLPLKYVPPVSDCGSDNIYPKELEQHAGAFLTADVLMLGTPRAFPDDWYQLDDKVAVLVPGKQLSSTLIVTSRDEDFELSVSRYSPSEPYPEPNRLAFTIRRPVVLRLYEGYSGELFVMSNLPRTAARPHER
jgi:hypothetical protein